MFRNWRRLGGMWVGLAMMAASGAMADEPEEMDTVIQVLETQQTAWNKGDINAFMEGYWKSDGLRFASGGTVTWGWQATLDRYRERYATREKMGTLSFSDVDVTLLAKDAALVFGRWKLQRKDDAPGGLFTLLFRKIDGKWVIVHDHTSGE